MIVDFGRSVLRGFRGDHARGGIEGFETPIVKDKQLHAAERPQQPSIAAVAAGKREIGEELWDALIENGAVIAAGAVAER